MHSPFEIFLYVLAMISLVIRLITYFSDGPQVNYKLQPPTFQDPTRNTVENMVQEAEMKKYNLNDTEISKYLEMIRAKFPPKPTTRNLPFNFWPSPPPQATVSDQQESFYLAYIDQLLEFLMLPKALKIMFVNSIAQPVQFTHYDGVSLLQIRFKLVADEVIQAKLARELAGYYL